MAWSTSGAAEWLSVSPSSGNSGTASINIDVQENTSKQSRTAFLRISDKSLESTIRISITQEAAPEEEDPIFNIDKNDFRVNADGGDIELKVTHNIDYK
uniref:BACON domain-containing protein n=1 Tax=Candidatus Cryptobacteroides bacterium TaxID=3085639 RepID=UPI00402812EC